MKFDENGKVIGFEVGDVFDDPDQFLNTPSFSYGDVECM